MSFPRLLVFSLLLSLAAPVAAQQPTTTDSEAARIAMEASAEIYSPFCPGKTLAMCTSSQAADTRREIQDMAEQGMSKAEIKEKIVAEFGDEFRYHEAGAFDDAWVLALIALGLLLAVLAVVVISRRRDPRPGDGPPAEVAAPETTDPEEDPYLAELRGQYRD